MLKAAVSTLVLAIALSFSARVEAQCGGTGGSPDMLIVLDESGSMSGSKWNSAKYAINTVTAAHEDKVYFGLETFDNYAGVRVGVNLYNRTPIMSWLNSHGPGGGTQIGCALLTANTYLSGLSNGRNKFVLLITDGYSGSSCSGHVYQATQLFNQGIKTFVVGFGSGVSPSQLNAIAEAGGTALPGATKYYNASNVTQLSQALGAIVGQVACCGDGNIDAALGEQCDDGNNADGDGCDSLCQIEIPTNNPPVASCKSITVSADAQCQACVSVNDGSSDPDGDVLTLTQTPDCNYSLGLNTVTLTVSDGELSDSCTATVVVEDTTAPTMTCPAAVSYNADAQCQAAHTFAPTAADNCSTITPVQTPAGSTWGLGTTSVDFSATDGAGNSTSCATSVTVTDVTPPTILCNAADILPKDAPVTYTATADDNCSVASVVITGYDCWAVNGAGKTIDKTGSCVVSYSGAALSITDAGGVGTTIDWTVLATDGSGNTFTKECTLNVQRSANQGVGNGPEDGDPGNSNQGDPDNSNDENGGTPGNPGKKGGKK